MKYNQHGINQSDVLQFLTLHPDTFDNLEKGWEISLRSPREVAARSFNIYNVFSFNPLIERATRRLITTAFLRLISESPVCQQAACSTVGSFGSDISCQEPEVNTSVIFLPATLSTRNPINSRHYWLGYVMLDANLSLVIPS